MSCVVDWLGFVLTRNQELKIQQVDGYNMFELVFEWGKCCELKGYKNVFSCSRVNLNIEFLYSCIFHANFFVQWRFYIFNASLLNAMIKFMWWSCPVPLFEFASNVLVFKRVLLLCMMYLGTSNFGIVEGFFRPVTPYSFVSRLMICWSISQSMCCSQSMRYSLMMRRKHCSPSIIWMRSR